MATKKVKTKAAASTAPATAVISSKEEANEYFKALKAGGSKVEDKHFTKEEFKALDSLAAIPMRPLLEIPVRDKNGKVTGTTPYLFRYNGLVAQPISVTGSSIELKFFNPIVK